MSVTGASYQNTIVANTSLSVPTIATTNLAATTVLTTTVNATGAVIVNAVTSNTTSTTSGVGVVGSLVSNTTIQANGVGYFAGLTSNGTTTTTTLNNSGTLTSNNVIVNNQLSVNGPFVISGNTVYNSTGFMINSGSSIALNSTYSVNRGLTGANATIRWNESGGQYWDILNTSNSVYYRILTQDLLTDSISTANSALPATANAIVNTITFIRGITDSGNLYAQSAFSTANSKLASAGGTITGALNVVGTLSSNTLGNGQLLYTSANIVTPLVVQTVNSSSLNIASTLTSVSIDSYGRLSTLTASPIAINASQITSGVLANTLLPSIVTPGSYTTTNITIDQYGRITSAANGSGGVTSVGGASGAISNTQIASFATAGYGFTPYSNTNPSGFITSGGAPVQSVGGYTGAVSAAQVAAAATSGYGFTPYSNANPSGYITSGGAPVQSVGGSTGSISNTTIAAAATSGYGFTPYSNTNPSGYITSGGAPVQSVGGSTGSISNTTIAAAASAGYGFTPYSNTNPSGYITSSSSITGNSNNATYFSGLSPQTAGSTITANQVARADASGYMNFGYIQQNTSNSENPTISQIIVTNGTDNFHRKSSIASLTGYVQTNASGVWGINISGYAALASALYTTSNYQVNSFGVGTGPSGTAGEIRATNNITAYYSDDRLKRRKGDIKNALDKISTLDAFYYEANEVAQSLGYKPVPEVGISAQQVQAIMPEVVAPAPIDDKYLTVRYERLVPLLIAAIKELKSEIDVLKGK